MSVAKQIKEYLLIQSPDYHVGVSLFCQINSNRNLQHSFMRCKDFPKLRYELKKYLDSQMDETPVVLLPGFDVKLEKQETIGFLNLEKTPIIERVIEITQSIIEKPIANKEVTSDQFDSIQQQIHNEWKLLYQKRSHFHGRMHEAISDESRYEFALELELIWRQIDEMNEYRRMMNEGDIPLRYIKEKMSADEYIRIRNLKQYISRTETGIANAKTVEEKKRLEQKLIEFKNELSRL